MPRKKSEGPRGRDDAEKLESQRPETPSDDPSGLPPAGAESAAEPDVSGEPPLAGGPVAQGEAPAAEAVDTAAAAIGQPEEADPAAAPGAPPDLSEPAEAAAPGEAIPLRAPEDSPGTPGDDSLRAAELDDSLRATALDDARENARPDPVRAPAAEGAGVEVTSPEITPREPIPVEPLSATPAASADHDAHGDEDEGGMSIAAWALGILLLLIAGAALGTWLAPKIAPALPAGMKPVAEWLEPGMGDTEAEIAALRSELQGVEAKVGAVPSADDLDARIGAAVAPVESRLSDEIGAVRQSLGELDPTETRQRLETLAAELQNQAAQFETLKSDFAGRAGQVSGDVNVFKADVEGLRAEVASLRDQVSAQATRLDAVAKSAEARVAAAEQQVAETETKAATALDAAATEAQQALIRAAVASGTPYADAVSELEGRGVTVPPALAAGAQSGIPTLPALRQAFPDAAHAAIKASIVAGAGDGVLARANAFLKAQVASRSLTPKPGPGTDAVLSRMEDKLRHDDLAGALAEAEALPSEAAGAMRGWLDDAKLRLGATDGLAALSQPQPATN